MKNPHVVVSGSSVVAAYPSERAAMKDGMARRRAGEDVAVFSAAVYAQFIALTAN